MLTSCATAPAIVAIMQWRLGRCREQLWLAGASQRHQGVVPGCPDSLAAQA
jgi:hypothetical protein